LSSTVPTEPRRSDRKDDTTKVRGEGNPVWFPTAHPSPEAFDTRSQEGTVAHR